MKDYLENAVPANEYGTLRVHVKRAWGLRAADANGKSDPFVIVETGHHHKRSKVRFAAPPSTTAPCPSTAPCAVAKPFARPRSPALPRTHAQRARVLE